MNISTLFWTIIIGLCTMIILLLHIAEPDLMKAETRYSATKLGAEFELIGNQDSQKINSVNGLQIININDGKLKMETAIKEGFIVTKLNGIKIQSINGLKRGLRKVKGEVVLEGLYDYSDREIKYVFDL